MTYWYNIQTSQVESDDEKSPGADLMGPYETREAAASALQSAAARTEAWDEQDRADRAWEDGEQA